MGNAPSKEPQGRSRHKRYNPRVTSSATAGLLTSNGQPAGQTRPHDVATDLISIPYSATASSVPPAEKDDDDDDDGDQGSQRNSAKAAFLAAPKVPRRLSLFRSKSSQEPSERRKSRRNNVLGSPTVPSEGSAVGRANSVSTHHPASESHVGLSISQNRPTLGARPTSWAYNLSSYEAQRILNLAQGSPPPLPRSQTSMPLTTETRLEVMPTRPWRRASIAVQPESAPISRSNSEMTLHPPMRRRSLIQTPGVATRTRPGPVSARSTRSSLRHSHPPTPSMSRQASLETKDSRFLSLPPLLAPIRVDGEVPRVHTPKETDYSTTGAFKFGTLRITNGSPVLTPSVAEVSGNVAEKSNPVGSSKDYLGREPHGAGVPTPTDQATAPAQSSTQPAEPQASGLKPAESIKPSSDSVGKATLPTLSITVPDTEPGGRSTSELQLGLDEMPEKPPASPLLQIQSRQAAVDDDLFEDDTQEEIFVNEVLDVRIDPNAKGLPPQSIDSTQTVGQGVKRSDSGFVSTYKSTSSHSHPHNSLAKADSGYSSNVSLRSLRNGKPPKKDIETGRSSTESEESPCPGGGLQKTVETQLPNWAVGGDGSAPGPQSGRAPPPPPKDGFLAKATSQPPGVGTGAGSEHATSAAPGKIRRKPVRQQPPAIDTSQNEDRRSLKSAESVPPTPASVKSEGSSSSLSIGNSTQKPGRLQRFLSLRNSPFSKQSFTVHETHAVDSKIPSIPKEVEDKLREHTGLFPMTTKRLALKSQLSKETLKTILSVGSLELSKDDELPPTPTFFDPEDEDEDEDEEVGTDSGDAKEKSLKQTFSSMQSNFKNAAASMMANRKPIARKPVPTRMDSQKRNAEHTAKEDSMLPAEAELTSYSSVHSSLGSNAYDAAAIAMKSPVRPGRSMSMATGRDHYLRLRAYSLNSTPSGGLRNGLSSLNSLSREGEGQRPETRTPSLSVGVATHGSFRMPPPRSPLSPQGPAVLQKHSRGHDPTPVPAPRPSSSTPSLALGMDHPASLDVQAQSPVGSHQHTTIFSPSARHTSFGSQRPSTSGSCHSSISSVQSDFLRESRSLQSYSQNISGPTLKHQSSLEGVGRNQLRGVYVPQPAHRGPASGPPSQFDVSSRHWNPQNSYRLVESGLHPSQLAWVPPYVPRGPHRRNLSVGNQSNYHHTSGSHAPYRILHSYNSPAYRNAPIWG